MEKVMELMFEEMLMKKKKMTVLKEAEALADFLINKVPSAPAGYWCEILNRRKDLSRLLKQKAERIEKSILKGFSYKDEDKRLLVLSKLRACFKPTLLTTDEPELASRVTASLNKQLKTDAMFPPFEQEQLDKQ